jgi:hypothetical protein
LWRSPCGEHRTGGDDRGGTAQAGLSASSPIGEGDGGFESRTQLSRSWRSSFQVIVGLSVVVLRQSRGLYERLLHQSPWLRRGTLPSSRTTTTSDVPLPGFNAAAGRDIGCHGTPPAFAVTIPACSATGIAAFGDNRDAPPPTAPAHPDSAAERSRTHPPPYRGSRFHELGPACGPCVGVGEDPAVRLGHMLPIA